MKKIMLFFFILLALPNMVLAQAGSVGTTLTVTGSTVTFGSSSTFRFTCSATNGQTPTGTYTVRIQGGYTGYTNNWNFYSSTTLSPNVTYSITNVYPYSNVITVQFVPTAGSVFAGSIGQANLVATYSGSYANPSFSNDGAGTVTAGTATTYSWTQIRTGLVYLFYLPSTAAATTGSTVEVSYGTLNGGYNYSSSYLGALPVGVNQVGLWYNPGLSYTSTYGEASVVDFALVQQPTTTTVTAASVLTTQTPSYSVVVTPSSVSVGGGWTYSQGSVTVTVKNSGGTVVGTYTGTLNGSTTNTLVIPGAILSTAGAYSVSAVFTPVTYGGAGASILLASTGTTTLIVSNPAQSAQTITFNNLPATIASGSAVTLSATTSSLLQTSFAVSGPGSLGTPTYTATTGITTVQLTATGGGVITITASQAGNSSFSAAPNVIMTSDVYVTPTTISFADPAANGTYSTTGSDASALQSGPLGYWWGTYSTGTANYGFSAAKWLGATPTQLTTSGTPNSGSFNYLSQTFYSTTLTAGANYTFTLTSNGYNVPQLSLINGTALSSPQVAFLQGGSTGSWTIAMTFTPTAAQISANGSNFLLSVANTNLGEYMTTYTLTVTAPVPVTPTAIPFTAPAPGGNTTTVAGAAAVGTNYLQINDGGTNFGASNGYWWGTYSTGATYYCPASQWLGATVTQSSAVQAPQGWGSWTYNPQIFYSITLQANTAYTFSVAATQGYVGYQQLSLSQGSTIAGTQVAYSQNYSSSYNYYNSSTSVIGGTTYNTTTSFTYTPTAAQIAANGSTFWISVGSSYPDPYEIIYSYNLTVSTQTPQVITFTPPSTATTGSTVTLTATGGASGNPVTFTIASGPGTLSGTNNSTLTVTGVGAIVINANQAGNTAYQAATPVTGTTNVFATIVPTTVAIPSTTTGLSLGAASGPNNYWYGNFTTGTTTWGLPAAGWVGLSEPQFGNNYQLLNFYNFASNLQAGTTYNFSVTETSGFVNGSNYDTFLFLIQGTTFAGGNLVGNTAIAGTATVTQNVAPATAGPYLVGVANYWSTASGTTDTADPYVYTLTVTATPTITNVTPNTVDIGGGTPVVITGSYFIGVTGVSFAGVAAANFSVLNTGQINATTAAGSATVGSVVVTAGSLQGTYSPFTYGGDKVSSISPNFGPITGGTSVTITGVGFTTATAVAFGTIPATSFTINSDTSITAVSPPAPAGPVNIIVTASGLTSTYTTADQFTYELYFNYAWTTWNSLNWSTPTGSTITWNGQTVPAALSVSNKFYSWYAPANAQSVNTATGAISGTSWGIPGGPYPWSGYSSSVPPQATPTSSLVTNIANSSPGMDGPYANNDPPSGNTGSIISGDWKDFATGQLSYYGSYSNSTAWNNPVFWSYYNAAYPTNPTYPVTATTTTITNTSGSQYFLTADGLPNSPLGRTSYVGNSGMYYFDNISGDSKFTNGPLYQDSKTKLTDITDGTSNTLFFGEALGGPDNALPTYQLTWMGTGTMPSFWDCQTPSQYFMFSSMHPGVVNFAFCDGSVRSITKVTASVPPDSMGTFGSQNTGDGTNIVAATANPPAASNPPTARWTAFQEIAGINDNLSPDYFQLGLTP